MGDHADDLMFKEIMSSGCYDEEEYWYKQLAKGLWNTSNGKILKIKDMDINHIKNTISYLEKAYEEPNVFHDYIKEFKLELCYRSNK